MKLRVGERFRIIRRPWSGLIGIVLGTFGVKVSLRLDDGNVVFVPIGDLVPE